MDEHLLFLTDQSGTMGPYNARLEQNMMAFINALGNFTTHWHLIVANSDNGCHNNAVRCRCFSI